MTRWHALALVALVLLSGCSSFVGSEGVAGDESPEPTVTPAPVPEVTPTPDPWPVAPGISGAGVVDVDTLVDAHLRAVRGQSYEFTERRGTSETSNGTVPMSLDHRARVESENTYSRWAVNTVGSRLPREANYSQYVVDGDGFAEVPALGTNRTLRRSIRSSNATARIGSEAAAAIRRYLDRSPGRTTVDSTRVDGQPYYRVESRGGAVTAVVNASNVTISALVSPAGFVRSLDVGYRETRLGDSHRVRYRFAYDRVGTTTVDPPDWVRNWNRTTPSPTRTPEPLPTRTSATPTA